MKTLRALVLLATLGMVGAGFTALLTEKAYAALVLCSVSCCDGTGDCGTTPIGGCAAHGPVGVCPN